jgi:hypothetical protein
LYEVCKVAIQKRQPEYPSGLDKVAEQFGISTPELLQEIASGELLVVRPPELDEEDTQERVLESFRQGWSEAMRGDVIPASELMNALRDDK